MKFHDNFEIYLETFEENSEFFVKTIAKSV
jgi:hypothetical protein